MKGNILSIRNVTFGLVEETKEEFSNIVLQHINEIEAKKNYAEIQYSTCVCNGQVVQCALIVERER